MDQCPYCRYRLDGLPDPGRCPECGIDYDEHCTVIWIGREVRQREYRQLGLLGLLAVLFWLSIRRVTWETHDWCLVGAAALGLFGILFRITWRGRPHSAIIINRIGVDLTRCDMPGGLLPWDRLAEVRMGFVRGTVIFSARDGSVLLKCPYRHFGDVRIAKNTVAAINRLRNEYCRPLP